MEGKKKIALILKNEKLRSTLEVMIDDTVLYTVVHSTAEHTVFNSKPDVVITDLQFHDTHNSIDTICEIRKKYKVLVLSEIQNPTIIFSALRAGASGYLLNNDRVYNEIIPRLNDLFSGGGPLSFEVSRIIVNSFHIKKSGLSSRETEVLKLLAKGKTYSEISKELLIARETSKTYIKNIYSKLDVNCKAQAIAKAVEQRIVYHRNKLSFSKS